MKKFNIESGRKGEEIAKKYLLTKGYKYIQSNFRLKGGEIDLIFSDRNKLIFVEVKLKIGENFGTPEEMINKNKLYQVYKTAQIYLKSKPQMLQEYNLFRIDAVCIILNIDDSIKRISHYENIGNEMD